MADGKASVNAAGTARVGSDTAAALNSGAIHLLRAFRAIDRRTPLSAPRLSALSVLVFGGPCTVGELARAEDVAGPTMTRIVDGLATAHLVTRRADPADGRAVLVTPTARGRRLMLQARDRRLHALVAASASLPATQRRALTAAAPALAALAEAVRAAEASAAWPARSPRSGRRR